LLTILHDAKIEEQRREERRLHTREEQFNKRHDWFFHWPPRQKPSPPSSQVIYIGCAALSAERRTYHDRIAKREDAVECYAYLQDVERRCLEDFLLEERFLATKHHRKPGDKNNTLGRLRML